MSLFLSTLRHSFSLVASWQLKFSIWLVGYNCSNKFPNYIPTFTEKLHFRTIHQILKAKRIKNISVENEECKFYHRNSHRFYFEMEENKINETKYFCKIFRYLFMQTSTRSVLKRQLHGWNDLCKLLKGRIFQQI